MNDIMPSNIVNEFSSAPSGFSFMLLVPMIVNILFIVLGVMLLVNLNIFLILKIKRMRKEDKQK